MDLRIRPARLVVPVVALLVALTAAIPVGPALAAGPSPSAPSSADPPPDPPQADGSPPATGAPPSDPAVPDPAADEPPGETVPASDETVPPPKGSYGDQDQFQPQEVLRSSVRDAEQKLAAAETTLADAVDRLRSGRHQRKQLGLYLEELDEGTQRVLGELEAAEERLVERAVNGFVADEAVANELIGSFDAARYDRVLDLQVRRTLLGVALGADDQAIAEYLTIRDHLEGEVATALDAVHWLDRSISATSREAREAEEEVVAAADELEAFRAGSTIYIDGVMFPVEQPYEVPLIDSWGFPRMQGTPDEHWHEGIDVFAPSGTPLVAAERGVVTRVGSGRLGGLTLWLRGESGAHWYYAHLSAHVDGLAPGQVVEAGEPVGYVGNTGNAASTPPHLHLEIHPDGGDAVNPYPLLKVISDRDLAGGAGT
jgi:murein DD-endopeptidase MepM/ murein hydrolase activator NlpD